MGLTRYADRAAVAGKIEWEGGIWAWLDYGSNPRDMPDEETAEALTKLRAHYEIAEFYAERFERLIAPERD